MHIPGLPALNPERAAAQILLAVLCYAIRRGESNEQRELLKRVREAAAWKVRGRPSVKGSLPLPFRFLGFDVQLSAVLEALIALAWTEDYRRHLQDPHTNVIAANSIEFGLHVERATLSFRFIDGSEWHGIFAPLHMPELPADRESLNGRLALRVSMSGPALIEMGKLCCAWDAIAEERIGVFANSRPMTAEPLTTATPAPAPLPPQPRRSRRYRLTDPRPDDVA